MTEPGASELVALLDDQPVGVLAQAPSGALTFTYLDAWRDRYDAYPLSLSMPLGRTTHPDSVVRSFLEGLLPDNQAVLNEWGRRFGVSPRNPFSLLTHMGADCPGAVQFIPRDRAESGTERESGSITWLTEMQVAERLRGLATGSGTGRLAGDRGQFSLAGAQPKTALVHDGRRWGIPSGRIPTTHILKPSAQPRFADFEVNEHLCLMLADALGISVPRSWVQSFDGQPTIVVERFDRQRLPDGRVRRIHQEDCCQALGVPPGLKYEAEGGPGAQDVIRLLVRESDTPDVDVAAFIDSLAFNWLIAGTDAHAKNHALMIGPGSVRLAPFFDLISTLPYDREIPYRKAKLAMRVDREYNVWKIRSRHWRGLAQRSGLDPEPVLERVRELAAAVPRALHSVIDGLAAPYAAAETVELLTRRIERHASDCLARLEGRP